MITLTREMPFDELKEMAIYTANSLGHFPVRWRRLKRQTVSAQCPKCGGTVMVMGHSRIPRKMSPLREVWCCPPVYSLAESDDRPSRLSERVAFQPLWMRRRTGASSKTALTTRCFFVVQAPLSLNDAVKYEGVALRNGGN
jgi:DNA-directed RNA polymerase subunit RPC12/RpoP